MAEVFYDGLVTSKDFARTKRAVARKARQELVESGEDGPAHVGAGLLRQLRLDHPPGWEGANPSPIYRRATENDTEDERKLGFRVLTKEEEEERYRDPLTRYQINSLRDLFGNPFRQVTIDPAWRTWNRGIVLRLAKLVYDERDLPTGTLDRSRLAVLADALEEAGCGNFDLLDHCRGPGSHFRGCWAVDLVLDKE
jgi:hypothetical protein